MKTRYSSYKGKVRAVSALVMSLATVTATGAVAADKLCDFAVYTSNGTTLQDRGLNRTIADPGRYGIGVEFAQICIR